METSDRQQHWETIYATKGPDQLSWTQPVPAASLHLLASLGLTPQARIIDIGGGDSLLVDHLVAAGYRNVTVLDLSAAALARAQARLGDRAQDVRWVVGDVLQFQHEPGAYDVWHDRAAFHFFTTPAEIAAYLAVAERAVPSDGYLTLGTFSTAGPNSCSGLPVQQYSEVTLTQQFQPGFTKIQCLREDHRTPFQTMQNFLFCAFRRVAAPAL
jgi:cyclopropane fatty-acyl-phospholipid synthase-like methyltransferase